MYTSPVIKRMRAAVEDAQDDAEFTARLIDAIDNDPAVRAAILRLIRRQATPTQPAKTATTVRGRRR
jgi:hypothetical protein